MAQIIFVTFMAVGTALGVFMFATLLTLVLYIILIEIRYWRRQFRIRKAYKTILRREEQLKFEQFTANAQLERRKLQREKDRLFLDSLRKALDEH